MGISGTFLPAADRSLMVILDLSLWIEYRVPSCVVFRVFKDGIHKSEKSLSVADTSICYQSLPIAMPLESKVII
uniref:Uncharacterized protein n=1 Tax=Heterorhabditis bacteriophora TaxID=37862 RepID=A0A1I7WQQ5_HETBA